MLVLYEAAGMSSDFASYLVRSLLSEGRLRYETVEKTSEGLRPRVIEREGPTGLIATTTALRLHSENETRLLSLTVSDTREQTSAVLAALAAEDSPAIDLSRWHAFQRWLELSRCDVAIPYARKLANAVPPVAVRLRRDFGAVLGLIRAHALIHQADRARDAEGRIVASLEDYAVVRDLVEEILAETVEATVKPEIRETVEAVRKLTDATEETEVGPIGGGPYRGARRGRGHRAYGPRRVRPRPPHAPASLRRSHGPRLRQASSNP